MNNLVTIAIFNSPTELAMIIGRLEAEGVECFVSDEHTVQVYNFHSNAVSGVKLQVKQSDSEKAIEILKATGYLKEENLQPPKFWIRFESLISKLPFIGKAKLETRLGFWIFLILLASAAALYVIIIPSTYEALTENNWCVDQVTFEGQAYRPNSMGFKIITPGYCNEKVNFETFGEMRFPGFNTPSVSGSWALTDNVLHITQVDTFQHILLGDYEIHIEGGSLMLTSDKTTISCYRTRW